MALRIAIISPNRQAYSETFITDLIAGLQGEKLVLIDGALPTRAADGTPLLTHDLTARLGRAVRQHIFGATTEAFQRESVTNALRAHRTEVVLAEYGPTAAAMFPVCKAAGIPLVAHFHGVDAYHHDVLMKHAKSYPEMLKGASAVIGVSKEMVRQLVSLGAPAERTHHISCGVDTRRFPACQPELAPPVLVAVGRFVEKKGPYLTLLSFQHALAEVPDARLVMIGDGPLLETCQRIARAMGIHDQVSFAGVLPHDVVQERLRAARGFVQHSNATAKNDREGTPVAVLEAMASGLPVVATRHAGIADAIEDGRSGLLSEEGDVRAMAVNLVRILQDPPLAARIGAQARARIEKAYTQRQQFASIQWLLEQAVRG